MTSTMKPATGGPALRVEGLGKRFGAVRALDDVTLDVRPGEVLALMGENGAGKSTLLKIITGDHRPDDGRLLLGGKEVSFGSPADARRAGVRVIAQEPEIIPHVSVAENVHVGALTAKGRLFSHRALAERTRADLERLGFAGAIDPGCPGERLSPAQRQLVEILRALTGEVRVLAFDEPTSSLSDHEVSALFALIRRLRDQGVAIVYVSHRMQEILRLADRVAVLRDGRLAGVRPAAETGEDELVRMMVGRDLSAMFQRERNRPGEPVLTLNGVTTDDVTDVSFEVRAGEVVGLAGLVGAGRSELARAVVGDLPIRSGEVLLEGRRLRPRSPSDTVRAGIGLAPEERKAQALLLHRSVRDNVSLAVLDRLSRFRLVRRAAERALVREYADRLRVKAPSVETEVRRLSGGNQQKVVLARWLARRPKVLILDEPTRGVDVGAKAEIYSIIDRLAADGVAVLVISSELPEVLGLADRIVVMQNGRVTGELDRRQAGEEQVLALAMADQITSEGAGQ
ncbi:sugar ABC transporter ATP-binding protein [Streptosporangium sp. NPDC004379]|uniref:sugar ABC transporter ATP-binding protein n=1 Tax=Streptosporangium sp. NPDC004379 TaxID=3366189 RepID=UPI0036A1375F